MSGFFVFSFCFMWNFYSFFFRKIVMDFFPIMFSCVIVKLSRIFFFLLFFLVNFSILIVKLSRIFLFFSRNHNFTFVHIFMIFLNKQFARFFSWNQLCRFDDFFHKIVFRNFLAKSQFHHYIFTIFSFDKISTIISWNQQCQFHDFFH